MHVCKVYLPVRGGVQKVVSQIVDQLPGFVHTVLTTRENNAIERENLEGVTISRSRSFGEIASLPVAPSLVLKFISLYKKTDLIAVHYPFPLAELALVFCWQRKPLVVHWHSNVVAQKYLRWLVAPLTFFMLRRATTIIATSSNMVHNSTWLKRFEHKVKLIPYGIPSAIPARVSAGDSDQAMRVTTAEPYFCLIGRHVSYKGFDIAIQALAHCSARIVIIGDGPLVDRHQLMVGQYQLNDRVQFIQQLDDAKLADILHTSVALVLSSNSHNEAFALVQLEAMRQGKAIINTDLKSSVPWVARHQQEAITVPPNEPKELAKAMTRLLDEPALANRLGKAGRARFLSHFSAETFSQRTNQAYQGLLKASDADCSV